MQALRDAMARSLTAVKEKKQKDNIDIKEDASVERRKNAETQSIIETNRDIRVNRRLRWRYASWVFKYLVIYSFFVGLIVVLDGFGIFGFSIGESVLEFLVGSTAVSAIGLVYSVVNGLFSKGK